MDLESQVEALLAVPPADAVTAFFAKVTEGSPGLEVRLDAGEGKGKGVFATKDFAKGSVLIQEPPLVGIQHTDNHPLATVCSHCFQYIGTVEEQIGQQLAWLRGAAKLEAIGEVNEEASSEEEQEEEESSSSVGDDELMAALFSGDIKLPLTDQVPLPEVVFCPGGCSEDKYCSEACAQAAWEQYHSLLCTGSGHGHADAAAEHAGSLDADSKGKAPAEAAPAKSAEEEQAQQQRVEALREFQCHADETNDVFLLAAKVVATVLLEARRRLEQQGGSSSGSAGEAAGGSGSGSSGSSGSAASEAECWAALQAAWEPFSMGHKALWWEGVASPEDVDDEAEFREEMRELAGDSLGLLRAAIYDPRFPALFDLRVWGSIIGMFELNNLGLFVPSPVARWRRLVEALPEAEREEVEEDVGPLLEALDALEEDGCEGNAFYTLQSCVNHSCAPNAHAFKRDEDTDGSAVILALRDITAGEEITISYIEEEAPLEERAAELADYGFTCACDKCSAERLAAELEGL